MNRVEFIRLLMENGCILLRHGAKHDIFYNPVTGNKQPVPQHTEIEDVLVKHIGKHLGLQA